MTDDAAGVDAALPDYEIGELLGQGQFGVVWAARHRRLRRAAAVKQLTGGAVADPRDAERFRREARLLAGLDHRHVVRVFDYREAGGRSLLIMERLTGGTLADRLHAGMDAESILVAVVAAASGLDHLHRQGVLHRDVKPANLMFDGGGVLKVTDFGTARGQDLGHGSTDLVGRVPAESAVHRAVTVEIAGLESAGLETTAAGEFVGTPGFAAPEQAAVALGLAAPPIGPAADQYALGVVLYQALTGCDPHAVDGGVVAVLARRAGQPARAVAEANPQVPPAFGPVMMRALERRPADRYPSVEDFGLALCAAAAATWGPAWAARSSVAVAEPGPLWHAVHPLVPAATKAATGATTPAPAAAPNPQTGPPPTGPPVPGTPVPGTPVPGPRVTAGPGRRRWVSRVAVGAVLTLGLAAGVVVALRSAGPADEPAAPTAAPAAESGAAAPGSTEPAVAAAPRLTLDWRFPTGGPVLATPSLAGDLVVVGSRDESVYGIEIAGGGRRWVQPAGGPVRATAALTADLAVVASDDGQVRALRLADGQEVWSVPVRSEVVAGPVVAGDTLFVAADRLYAFALDTRAERFAPAGIGGSSSSTPAVAGDRIVVGSNDGQLYGFSTTDGTEVWRVPTGGAVLAPPVVADGVAYVGSRGRVVVAVDVATGAEIWRQDVGAPVHGAAAVGRDRIVVATTAGTLLALSRGNGAVVGRWVGPGRIDAAPVLAGPDGAVVVVDSTGRVMQLDGALQRVLAQYDVGAPVLSSPRVADGALYVGDQAGVITRLRLVSG